MSELFEKLNPNQKEAVESLSGPVMVIAGAGSGKTRVLTHRLAYLIECGVEARNILAVTFTNKAAMEMKERVEKLVGNSQIDAWVMTFHSMCARILRTNAQYVGYKNSFDIIDDEDSMKVLKEVMKELNLDPKQYPPKMYRNLISAKKNGKKIMLEDVEKIIFENVNASYQNHLKRENLMDFDDLLILTVLLFEQNPNVLDYYQDKFRYIMIDEFQDTNVVQFKLVDLLANKYRNIFIVGDEDQSIYSFRGANIDNIKTFMKLYEPKKIILDTNYRSTQNILNVANCLIDNNKSRIKKDLKSVFSDGALITFRNLESAYEEETFIIRTIDELHRNGVKYKDMAVFYRNNALSRGIEEAFMKCRIPYKIFGGISFFGRKEIKDILAFLKLILDGDNSWAFKRVINVPKRGIGNVTLDKINNLIEQGNSLKEAIKEISNPKVTEFFNMINRLTAELSQIPITQYVERIMIETGYKKMLEDEDEEERIENINELKSVLAEADETYEGLPFEKLKSLLDYLSLRTDKDETATKVEDYVNLMTFHQAKGLEFRVVFMMALEEGIFPRDIFDSKELEEERRVAYVGITRAKEMLYLTCAKSRRLYGQIRLSIPSLFIREIDSKFIKGIAKKTTDRKVIDNKVVFDKIKKEEVIYKAGDKINHQYFGDGVIVAIDGDFISVAFKVPFGIKKLLGTHPSITKLENSN